MIGSFDDSPVITIWSYSATIGNASHSTEAWDVWLDSDLFHRRDTNETMNAAIERKLGAFGRSRLSWTQFREPVIECVVHGVGRSPAISHEEGNRP